MTAPPATLICPNDRTALQARDDRYACPACGESFPVEHGVVRFLRTNDPFYEGAYVNDVKFIPRSERLRHVLPLWLINSGYVWRVRTEVPAGSVVVELGCAGGVLYFGKRYHMIGVDLSYASLRPIASRYELCVQADASALIPLATNSVDAIVSSFFWEHIAPEIKPLMLRECLRVLKPGGKLIFLYDVQTDNPLIARAKRVDLPKYNRLFLEGDGHVGYEPPAQNRATFRDAGFDVKSHVGMEKTWLQSPSVYQKLSEWQEPIATVGRLGARLGRPPLFYAYTALVRCVDETVGRLLPEERARIVLSICEKPAPTAS